MKAGFAPWQIAAYLIDRADQYETESPCWVALADTAENVMNGTFADVLGAGELDDLRARVERWKSSAAKTVDPSLGVECREKKREDVK